MKTYIVYFIDGSKVEIKAESHTAVTGGLPVTFLANKIIVASIPINQVRAVIDKTATEGS